MRYLYFAFFMICLVAPQAGAQDSIPQSTSHSSQTSPTTQSPQAILQDAVTPPSVPPERAFADYSVPLGPDANYPRVWGRVEALLWWTEGLRVPALVTNGATPPTVLFGGTLNDDVRAGIRADLGTWIFEGKLGIQGGFFFLSDDFTNFSAGSPAPSTIPNRQVNRPFINAITGLPANELVVAPGLAGTVTVNSSTTGVVGADALLRTTLCCYQGCSGNARFDLLGGYRYFGLNDRLTIQENLMPVAAPFTPGTQIVVTDTFRTRNRFNGGSIGGAVVGSRGPLSAELSGRLDIGEMEREVMIFGSTFLAVPGALPVSRTGGLLTQASNVGTYRSSSTAVIPEFDLRLGYQLTSHIRLTVGYTLIVLNDVARAGDQIDLRVNPNQLPNSPIAGVGPALPAFTLRQSSTFIQGVSVGMAVTW